MSEMKIRKCRNTWQCCDGECAKCETSATNYTVSDYMSIQAKAEHYCSYGKKCDD